MKLNEIRDNPGAFHSKKVVGRGVGSGLGKTSGKGHKGQKARGVGKVAVGFEGGQTPLYRRMPKRGFNNIFAKNIYILNLADLSRYIEKGILNNTDEISYLSLREVGLIKGRYDGLKILAKGECDQVIRLKVSAISKKAEQQILASGGSVEIEQGRKKFLPKKQLSKTS